MVGVATLRTYIVVLTCTYLDSHLTCNPQLAALAAAKHNITATAVKAEAADGDVGDGGGGGVLAGAVMGGAAVAMGAACATRR